MAVTRTASNLRLTFRPPTCCFLISCLLAAANEGHADALAEAAARQTRLFPGRTDARIPFPQLLTDALIPWPQRLTDALTSWPQLLMATS